jgi:quinol monooxygenase YgiN
MKKPVYFTVSFNIMNGRRSAFEAMVREMVAASSQEPGCLAYDFYVSADGTQSRLLEAYVDNEAAVAHLTGPVVTDLVPKLLESATLEGFEVYGDASPQLAQILANFGAKILANLHGYRR